MERILKKPATGLRLADLDEKDRQRALNLYRQVDGKMKTMNMKSRETKKTYRSCMKTFARYLAVNWYKESIKRVHNRHIKGFIIYLQGLGFSKSRIETSMSAIRYFYYELSNGRFRIWDNKEFGVKSRSRNERIGSDKSYSEKDLKRLLRKCKGNGHKTMVKAEIALRWGLRLVEVFRMRKSQLRKGIKRRRMMVKGKGGQVRYLNLSESDIVFLKSLLEKTSSKTDYLFVDEGQKTHLEMKKLQNRIRRYMRGLTFHGLRHTFAGRKYKDLLNMGVKEIQAKKIIAKLLGHHRSEIVSTYLYAK